MYLFPVTKKILLGMAALWMGAAFVFPGMGWAIFGSQGNDYSANAGSTFYCANPAGTAVTTQAGLSATNPALTLVNPSGSNKRVVLLETQIVPTALPLTLMLLQPRVFDGGDQCGAAQCGDIHADGSDHVLDDDDCHSVFDHQHGSFNDDGVWAFPGAVLSGFDFAEYSCGFPVFGDDQHGGDFGSS